jgi:mono/diheme cytochrome c family protein
MRSTLCVLAVVLVSMTVSVSDARADEAQVKHGMDVYKTQKCSLCHIIAGVGKKHELDGVGAKLSADQIREWLTNPKDAAAKAKSTAKPVMKDYSKLPKEDLDALVAYLQTLTKK